MIKIANEKCCCFIVRQNYVLRGLPKAITTFRTIPKNYSKTLLKKFKEPVFSIINCDLSRFQYGMRTFHYKSSRNVDSAQRNTKQDHAMNQEELCRTVFAEGYYAGRSTGGFSTSWKTIIFSIIGGVLIGLFLPAIIITSTIASQEREESASVKTKRELTKFSDVKGIDDIKQELKNVVEFLKFPDKFTRLGAKLPKGILLVGPPGTGKTLLARALAGEANVPYFHMSGSEFEQTFVGEGARKVRELFRIAKKNSPCVVFIDEIDSVGSKRFQNPLHPHANQTINQLLTEMDGFNKLDGVIVLAATNRKDDLDEALLRPGRFDVEIYISPPSYEGRKEILEHYLSRVLAKDLDMDILARGTVGFTGADLESMVNRAALRAGLRSAPWVTSNDLLEERDRIMMGPEKSTHIPDERANLITAYHEGGHCIVAYFTPHSQPIHKVTIIPRGNALGITAYLPEKDEVYMSKAQLLARIDSLLGGRAAEELIFGEEFITTGAASDLQIATELATQMVTRWGMSQKVGLSSRKAVDLPPAKVDRVDEEVRRILEESYERAKNTLKKRSSEHKALAEALLMFETLDASEIERILSGKS